MDWIQTIVIIASFFGGFIYLMSKLDNLAKDSQEVRKEIRDVEKNLEDKIQSVEKNLEDRIQNVEKRLDQKIQNVEKRLDQKIQNVERHLLTEMKSTDLKISNIEGQITQMTRPNIIPFDHGPKSDPKEN